MSDSEHTSLMNLALRKLSYRSQSVGEMKQYLSRKTESEMEIEKIICTLTDMDLLDDEAFAEEWVQSRIKKGKGERVIGYELKQKMIDQDIIDAKIEDVAEEDWVAAAKKILAKKRGTFNLLNHYQRVQKMKQLLYGRGFSSRIIATVIDDLGA